MLETDQPLPAMEAVEDGLGGESGDVAYRDQDLAGLLAFRRLDLLLAEGVRAARERYGPEAASDSYRGLYLTEEQVQRAMRRRVGEPLAAARPGPPVMPQWDRIAADNPRWAWLRDRFDLTEFELDVILIALGPDLDRRYEQLYGYLQDDVSARRPTVNLALDLLTTSPSERLAALPIFAGDSRLIRDDIVTLRTDGRDDPPLITKVVAIEAALTASLLGHRGLDHRLSAACRIAIPGSRTSTSAQAESDRLIDGLEALLVEAWGRAPLRLCFHGSPGTGRRRTALALGERLSRPVLLVDGSVLAREPVAVPDLLRLVLRQAELDDALVYVAEADIFIQMPEHLGSDALVAALAAHPGIVILGTARSWRSSPKEPLGVISVPFRRLSAVDRRRVWRREVKAAGASVALADVAAVGDRFRLSPRQIRDAALTATGEARLRRLLASSSSLRLTRAEMFSAARRQSGDALTAFARRIRLVHGWDDLVVPDEVHGQLRELAARVEHRTLVMDKWGFASRLANGRGVTALFAGPSGTGKTMAAGVIAAELGLDLFAIDLSTVVSKYIGETEKNLSRVFDAASDTDAVLFFDEADALFGKRSEVRDAHDRYANIEIAYLLQRMEQYDGLAVLATNVRHHLDDAFTRRLDVIVDFPFPGVSERERIWRACLPPELPLAEDVDLAEAAQFRLPGGNIRNAALGAAFLAAADGAPVGRCHLVDAVRREYQKIGKIPADPDP